jgi:hypothetical protein
LLVAGAMAVVQHARRQLPTGLLKRTEPKGASWSRQCRLGTGNRLC